MKAALERLPDSSEELPPFALEALSVLAAQIAALDARIEELELQILTSHRQNETSGRLATIPGIGPIAASGLAASVPDSSLFKSGRGLKLRRPDRARIARERRGAQMAARLRHLNVYPRSKIKIFYRRTRILYFYPRSRIPGVGEAL